MVAPFETQLPPANKIFVDREHAQRVFEDAVFAIPSDRPSILVFYGVGGQGKTALCRELMEKTSATVEPSYSFLRRAELDLHDRRKDDPDRLLVWLRNGFADAGVVFPCFDLAFAIAWEATRGEEPVPKFTKPWLSRATKFGEFGVDEATSLAVEWLKGDDAKELIGNIAGSVPGIGFALKLIGNWVIEKGKRAYLERTKDALRELYRGEKIKKPYELSSLLPWMLAQDLNSHLTANPRERFVLLIDEYERVFDEGGAGSTFKERPFDVQMRELIANTKGLLAVFFSRERLPWSTHPVWRDLLKDRQHLLGGLADKDAEAFLLAVPIEDKAIRQAIIAGARETSRPDAPIYPLMLDLQVEHWRALTISGAAAAPGQFQIAADSFEERRWQIVSRVLRDYGRPLETTLERLAVARRFDRQAFTYVVQAFGTALPLDQFDRIADLSFVTKSTEGFLTIHSAIAETIRASLIPEKRAESVEALFRHFEERAKVATVREVTDKNVAALLEAAFLRLAQSAEGYVAWLREASEVVSKAARYATVAGLWREAASVTEARLGPDHPDVVTCLNKLAGLLRDQGDFTEARRLFERALALRERLLGADHPDTATTLNNVGRLLREQHDFAGARRLFERALAIHEAKLGYDHPKTVTSRNLLARLLREQRDFAGARPLFERALLIRETKLGPDHPYTLRSLYRLARLLRDQGDITGVRQLYQRADVYKLAQAMTLDQPDHPDMVTGLNYLARLLQDQGDFAGAQRLFERALAINEKTLGSDHPETARSLNNIGRLLRAQRDFTGARPLFERALLIRETKLGPDHPSTVRSRYRLARLPQDERVKAISEQTLGPNPSTDSQL